MMEFRACRPDDIRSLEVQPEQRLGQEYVIANGLVDAAATGLSYSGWLDGRCIAVGGLVPQWDGHGVAWLMASLDAGPEMLRLTRFTRGLFAVSPYRRISVTVACDFPAAHRWARLLGMALECERMVAYDPFGRDAALYAWIRKT